MWDSDLYLCVLVVEGGVSLCAWLPDKVQEGIGSANLLYLLLLGELIFWSFPRVDDEHHDDANDHSDNSGGGVVDHCPHPHFARGPAVQSCHTWEGHITAGEIASEGGVSNTSSRGSSRADYCISLQSIKKNQTHQSLKKICRWYHLVYSWFHSFIYFTDTWLLLSVKWVKHDAKQRNKSLGGIWKCVN